MSAAKDENIPSSEKEGSSESARPRFAIWSWTWLSTLLLS